MDDADEEDDADFFNVAFANFASAFAVVLACIFAKFLVIHDDLSGNGSLYSTALPPLRTFCSSLGAEKALLVEGWGVGGVFGGVKNCSSCPGCGDRGGELFGVCASSGIR